VIAWSAADNLCTLRRSPSPVSVLVLTGTGQSARFEPLLVEPLRVARVVAGLVFRQCARCVGTSFVRRRRNRQCRIYQALCSSSRQPLALSSGLPVGMHTATAHSTMCGQRAILLLSQVCNVKVAKPLHALQPPQDKKMCCELTRVSEIGTTSSEPAFKTVLNAGEANTPWR
jgi:hypothetical protein